ncbi:MAG: lipid A Kdo2 1-phosphate O-methyltransferase [Leptospiraceae bacterium]|nr:lipid A Kdo2 1-phosphate O-methyltransferase [Leptospiraceae bacterium]
MALLEELEKQGNFLFRWRSYIPSIIVFISMFYVADYKYIGGKLEKHHIFLFVCFLVSLFGLFIRCYTIGYAPEKTSGRNTKKQVADTVNQTGIYSLIRHPLYVGNFFMFFGIVLFVNSLSLTLIFILFYWMYYERIMYTEEHFLRGKFGPKYLLWADKTPALIPNFREFKPAGLNFSYRNIIKREYPSLFGLVIMFLLYDLIFTYFNEPSLSTESFFGIIKPYHKIIFLIDFVFYLFIRALVKLTKIFHVEGR